VTEDVFMDTALRRAAEAATGFMPPDEGLALYEAAAKAVSDLPGLPLAEVGTYCGKSTLYVGAAAKSGGTVVVTVDHHRGSEENQPGWEWHDSSLVDPEVGRLETLPTFRRTIAGAGLEDSVIAIVGRSEQVGRTLWSKPVAFLFLDGGHTEEQAQADYEAWAPHLAPGGTLVVHDVFPDPADGGQAPWHVVERAIREGFVEVSVTGSLRVLQRPATA
jgi:predicted O-methyltransferase YrrM